MRQKGGHKPGVQSRAHRCHLSQISPSDRHHAQVSCRRRRTSDHRGHESSRQWSKQKQQFRVDSRSADQLTREESAQQQRPNGSEAQNCDQDHDLGEPWEFERFFMLFDESRVRSRKLQKTSQSVPLFPSLFLKTYADTECLLFLLLGSAAFGPTSRCEASLRSPAISSSEKVP